MPIFLSYDLEDEHDAEFREKMISRGYADTHLGKKLPRFTLTHSQKTSIEARYDAFLIAKDLQTSLKVAVCSADDLEVMTQTCEGVVLLRG